MRKKNMYTHKPGIQQIARDTPKAWIPRGNKGKRKHLNKMHGKEYKS